MEKNIEPVKSKFYKQNKEVLNNNKIFLKKEVKVYSPKPNYSTESITNLKKTFESTNDDTKKYNSNNLSSNSKNLLESGKNSQSNCSRKYLKTGKSYIQKNSKPNSNKETELLSNVNSSTHNTQKKSSDQKVNNSQRQSNSDSLKSDIDYKFIVTQNNGNSLGDSIGSYSPLIDNELYNNSSFNNSYSLKFRLI